MGKQYELSHLATAAKTGAGRRAVESRLPKVLESPKSLLALKGHATSAVCTALLNDLHALKKPHSKKLQRKNDVLPFESGGETHLENLARLNDCSLLALVNHTKKRPHNLILGRTFAFRTLDLFEFAVTNYAPAASFPPVKSAPGSKPLLLFNGDDFGATETTRTLKSLLLDLFRGPADVNAVSLAGVDRLIVFTLKGDSCVHFRHYAVELRKVKDSTLPTPHLKEAGPHFDMTLRRTQIASEALRKEAMRKPKDPRAVRKTKNVHRDEMGDKKGQMHMGRQDLSGLALARMKGLNKKRGHKEAEKGETENGGEQNEEEQDAALDNEAEEEPAVASPAKRQKLAVK